MHQLVVSTESGSAAAGGVSLHHVPNQPVGLGADLDLVLLSTLHEQKPRLIEVVAEACGRRCQPTQ